MSDQQAVTPSADTAEGDRTASHPASRLSARAKIILLLVAVAVIVAGVLWYAGYEAHGKYRQETNDAELRADTITVSPRTAGYVAEVLVQDDQDVVAGQPLVRIDSANYKAQAAQAQADIAVAQASADNVRATIREQYATIAQSRAQAAAAQAKADHDAAEVARYVPLAASGAETREKLAQLRATAIQSSGDARAQVAAVVAQQRRVETLGAQIRQSEAQARGARAKLRSANVDVGATLIRAPSAGRVGDRTVTVGQYAQTGAKLMSLVPLDRQYIVANFKETQLGLMRVGQPATIHVDALSGVDLRGRVESVSPGTGAQFSLLPPQNATGNFTKIVQRVPVRISVEAGPETRRLLVPGLSLTVAVDTISAKGADKRIADEQKRLDRQVR